jgi:GTP cyclohydrolase I
MEVFMQTNTPRTPVVSNLPDHATEPETRGVAIQRVGIKDLRYPIQVLDQTSRLQSTVANISLYVALPEDVKGTHMSRFVEILNAVRGEMTFRNMPQILDAIQDRLEAECAYIELEFPYFVNKRAPVSGAESLMEYTCRFHAARTGTDTHFELGVRVPVKSLCPCSKAVSAYGAHNQRSLIDVDISSDEFVWLEDLITAVEGCGSAPLYALLKREDEKFVTEQAYDNPKFVEDLVRDVVIAVRALPGVRTLKVGVENLESIHNHAAFAETRWSADGEEPPQTAWSNVAAIQPAESFGSWLRGNRQARQQSQRNLAAQLDISPSYLSRVESDEKPLSEAALKRLAQVWALDAVTVQLRAGSVPEDLLDRIRERPEAFQSWAEST